MDAPELLKHLSSATFEVRTNTLLPENGTAKTKFDHDFAVQEITKALVEAGVDFKTSMRRGSHKDVLVTHILVGNDMLEERD